MGREPDDQKTGGSDKQFFDGPLVYLIDFEKEVGQKLAEAGFKCANGAMDSFLDLSLIGSADQKMITPYFNIASNLHEYDIVLINLAHEKTEPFDIRIHGIEPVGRKTQIAIAVPYPQQYLDLQPFIVNHLLQPFIEQLIRKNAIIIAFYGEPRKASYKLVTITDTGSTSRPQNVTYRNIDFHNTNHYLTTHNKCGFKVEICDPSYLSWLLEKYQKQISYKSYFSTPPTFTEYLTPLIVNEAGEIISYGYKVNESYVFVFPQIDDTAGFVKDLLSEALP